MPGLAKHRKGREKRKKPGGKKNIYTRDSKNFVSKACPSPHPIRGPPRWVPPELCRAPGAVGVLGPGRDVPGWVSLGRVGGLGAQGRVEAMGRPCCPVHRRLRAVGSRNPLPMRVSPLPPALLHPAGERQQAAAGRGRGEGGLCCTSPTSSCPIPQEMGGRQPGAPPAMGTSPWGGLQGVSAR